MVDIFSCQRRVVTNNGAAIFLRQERAGEGTELWACSEFAENHLREKGCGCHGAHTGDKVPVTGGEDEADTAVGAELIFQRSRK